jgi:5,10-methylenetetrahydromethanopterin reductase
MILALAAERTSRIGLGPGVLIPSLRHVVANAAAVLTLETLAPGRVAVGVGAGFSGRLPLGRSTALPWREVREYLAALRALLAGEPAELGGTALGLLHGAAHGPPRPVDVPILVAADGPKGRAVAAEYGDGVFATRGRLDEVPPDPRWTAVFDFAMVLADGQDPAGPEVLDTMGWVPAMIYHSAYLGGHIDRMPGGERFRAALDAIPEHRRHLALHEGHMVELNPRDRSIPSEALHAVLARAATVGDSATVAAHLRDLAGRGVHEVAVHIPVARAEEQLERLALAAKGIVGTDGP